MLGPRQSDTTKTANINFTISRPWIYYAVLIISTALKVIKLIFAVLVVSFC